MALATVTPWSPSHTSPLVFPSLNPHPSATPWRVGLLPVHAYHDCADRQAFPSSVSGRFGHSTPPPRWPFRIVVWFARETRHKRAGPAAEVPRCQPPASTSSLGAAIMDLVASTGLALVYDASGGVHISQPWTIALALKGAADCGMWTVLASRQLHGVLSFERGRHLQTAGHIPQSKVRACAHNWPSWATLGVHRCQLRTRRPDTGRLVR